MIQSSREVPFPVTNDAMMRQTKIKVNNVEINYLKVGNGPRTLFLLCGTLGAIENFNMLIPLFDKEKYTVIVWDPPGYGQSRPPDRDFSPGYLHRDADLVISLMNALQIKKYSLIGWCSGGTTALIVASKAVDQVENLITWNCNAYVNEKDLEFYKKKRDIRNWPLVQKENNLKIYGEKYFSETWAAWVDSCQMILENNNGDICQKDLTKIKAPTLILHGAQDIFIPVEHAIYINKNIKQSTLEIYPEGKHVLHIMYPERFIASIEHFLNKNNNIILT